MVEYTTEELFGNSAGPGFSGAEVFGNNAQPPSVPSSGGGLSSAEVFGPSAVASPAPGAVPPTTTPLANASASPPMASSGGMSSAEVFGQQQPQAANTSSHWSITRGLVSGFAKDYPQLAGETLEGLSHFAPEHFKGSLRSGADYLRSIASEPAGYERRAPELKNVKGLDDALTWAGETFGQGTASTAAPIALGAAGYGVGGVPGAVVGGVAGGSFQNYGEVYKALKDAGVEPERAAKLSALVLPIISGLDVAGMIPASRLLMGGVKETVKQGLVKMIAKEAGKSAASEGGTEMLQELTKQGTISAETGKPLFTTENAWALLENALGGALVGGPFGAGAAALPSKKGGVSKEDLIRPPTPQEVEAVFGTHSGTSFNDQQLDVLRRMVNERQSLTPEGGNFTSNVAVPTPPDLYPTSTFIGTNADGDPVFERPNGRRVVKKADGTSAADTDLLTGPNVTNTRLPMFDVVKPANSVQSAMASTQGEQYGPGPLWYDKAEEAAQTLPESGTAQQMRNTLINKGVRLDNLTWTGLDEFFHSKGANIQATPETILEQTASGQPSAVLALENWKAENWGNLTQGAKRPAPPAEMLNAANAERADLRKRQGEAARAHTGGEKVTKQDILNHLRENRYTLKEQIRDDITSPITPQERAMQEEQLRLRERLDELDRILDDDSRTMHGGERGIGAERIPLLEEWNQTYVRLNEVSRILNDNNVKRPSPEYSSFVAPGERRGYATLNIQVPANERAGDIMAETPRRYYEENISKARGYRQPHFTGDQYRNTIAFATITLREDISGQMIAHIEQIQSDWQQLARTQGYITPALLQQEIVAQTAQDKSHAELEELLGKYGPMDPGSLAPISRLDMQIRDAIRIEEFNRGETDKALAKIGQAYGTSVYTVAREYAAAIKKNNDIGEKVNKAIADAPYKMTQDWTRLMLRRVLRWAADRGIQRVTWNNPELAWQYPTGSAGAATQDPAKMDPETRRRWEGIKKHYGQTIPSVAKELARQYGGDVGITQIRTSSVGPWVARPFVTNGVVTGWGVGREEGQPGVFSSTTLASDYGYNKPFATEEEASSVIAQLKTEGKLRDVQVSKFSNQVMYLDFDRRAQWNFQTKGFPSFMLNPNVEPAAQPKVGSFDVYEDTSLRNLPIRTPLQEAAYRFADALGNIQKRFGFKGDFELVLYGAERIQYPGQAPLALHTYDFDSKKHTIEVSLNEIENLRINGAIANDAFKVAQLWSTMMHEFGHAVMWEKYDQLPAGTKLAIQAAYDKFITDTDGMRTLGERVQRRQTAIGILMSDNAWRSKDWNALPQQEREYWAGFDEWFAEQVARWGTVSDRPLSIVEKALKGISDMLRAVFDMMTKKLGLNLRPEKVMEDWLNSFLTTEQGFGHQQSLNNDAQTVKTDQIAIRSEEPDMFVPVRSAQADTIKQSAMAATSGSTPAGVASSAVHASRFNFMYKYMGNLAHLAEANPFFAPLIRYVERIRRMHLDETNIHDAAVRIRKDWRDLQGQSENLVAFINDLVNLDFLTPAEKAAGVIRQPNPIEQNVLVTKHKLSAAGLKVFQKIKILNDWVLDLTAQSAKKSATRIITDPVVLMNKITEIDSRVLALKQRPFFPFMRFGRNFVIQKDTAGNTVHFETFERIGLKSAERQQQQRVEELRRQFPGYPDPEVGVLPEAAAPFVGMPPMLLEEIRTKMTLTPSQVDALENLMYNHSTATKFPRAFKQNYTKGYSMDFQRSFARYFFYAGRYYARAEHAWELNDDIRAARMVGGNTASNIANFMSDHLKNTVLEAKGDFGILKGGIFLWAMGYVPAAATQNLTQTPMITFPYLAGKFGDIKATRAMANAMRQMSTFYRRGRYEKTGNRELEALDYGVKHGIITESQASELAAASQGMNLLKGIGGGVVARNWQAFMEKSAWMFEMAEQWNRRIAYRAAYNLALENPNAEIVKEAINAYRGEFNSLASKYGDRQYAAAIITASYVTTKTQYDYSRAFRPRFMRGRLPGTLFVFKTYMANTLWMLANNKSDVLPRFLIISALMGGLAGIPGYEDLRDILKALGHWMNKDFNVEHALRQFVNSHFDGKVPPDMIIGGMARRGYGIPALLDLLGSFATGIPGRGFDGKQQGQNVPFPVLDRHRAITLGPLLPVELGKLFDPTDDINRTISEQSQRASGAVFSVGFNIYKAIMDNKLAATDPKRWERAIPRELGDLTRTWRAFSEGRERSRGGVQSAPTIAEFNWRDSEQAAEMLAMATGYQPLRVQAKWDSIMAQVEVQKFYEMQQKTLFGQLFEARKGANQGEIDSVLESIRRFNRELPIIARGYTITQENAKASIMGRERELIARERGVPTQKRNVPISRYVNELFPETTVDVRRVR